MGLTNVRLHLVDTVADCEEFMRWLSTKTRVAYDVESTGVDPMRDRIRLVQIGDAHDGWAIPFERWSGLVYEVVNRYEGEYVMHNMSFDWMISSVSAGIDIARDRVHDTRIMAHILRPDLSTALKKISARLIDPAAPALQRTLDDAIGTKGGWTWATVPYDYQPYWSYGALDTVLTARLDEILRPEVMAIAPRAYDIERAATWVTADMSRRGTMIDRVFTQEKYEAFVAYCEQVEKWCVDTYGVKPGQNAAIIAKLQEYGFEFSKATASGALSLDKEVLGGIDHPLAKTVLSRRQTQKVASTYLLNFLELADADDLLHPRINTLGFNQSSEQSGKGKDMGVRTSRMSMDTPNLQNLSRNPGEQSPAAAVRNCIVSRPDHTLLMCDFAQVEARMFAHLADDPDLKAAFLADDFFTEVARTVYEDPNINKKDPRRQPTKNGVYAKYYGAGTEKFAQTAGIPVEQAAAWNQRFDQMYPRVRQFQNEIVNRGIERFNAEGVAYVRSPLTGRQYRCDEGKEYVLVNYLIQGTAAEVLKIKLAQLAAAGLDQFMILPVHDEVIMDVPDDQLYDAAKTTVEIMSDDQMFSVPLKAEPSIGKRWGEKKDYDL